MHNLFETLEDYDTSAMPEIYAYDAILTKEESESFALEESAHFLVCEDPECTICGQFDTGTGFNSYTLYK